jgi:hypothetical protein
MSDAVGAVGREVQRHLAEMAELFVEDARLTLVMRVPGKPGGWFVIGSDQELQDRVVQGLRDWPDRKE